LPHKKTILIFRQKNDFNFLAGKTLLIFSHRKNAFNFSQIKTILIFTAKNNFDFQAQKNDPDFRHRKNDSDFRRVNLQRYVFSGGRVYLRIPAIIPAIFQPIFGLTDTYNTDSHTFYTCYF